MHQLNEVSPLVRAYRILIELANEDENKEDTGNTLTGEPVSSVEQPAEPVTLEIISDVN